MTDRLPRSVRLGRAGALIGGAVVYAALVYGPLEFFWTPLLLGLAYLAAAATGGRRGGLWSTGLVLAAWGIGVLLVTKFKIPGLSSADAYLMAAGAAALAGGLMAHKGFSVDLVGVGATAFLAGLLHAVAHQGNILTKPWFYVTLLAVVGAVNLVLAFAPQPRTGRSPSAADPRGARTAGEAVSSG